MRNKVIVCIVLSLLVFVSAPGVPAQSTEFTYQGNLVNTGTPANGVFDFEFLLFGDALGGGQLGTTQTRNAVSVTGGTFSVALNFGDQFDGSARFLEIRVRLAGSGSFTTLAPRQSILSTPYAVKSLTAENAATAATAVTANSANSATSAATFTGGLAGDVTGGQGATTVERLRGRNVAGTAPANGQVLKFNSATSQWEPGTDETATAGGGGGTITGVAAGTGLSGGGSSGNVTLSIANGGVGTPQIADASVTDAKIVGVSGAKVTGAVANATNAVTATTAATAVSATTAATATTATSFTGNLGGDVTGAQGTTTVGKIQGRSVANTAPSNGQVLKFNTTTSQWEPGNDETATAGPGGTITGVTAGTGLTGGGTSGSVTVSIANGGVNTTQLADSSVTTPKLANSSVTDAKIVDVAGAKVTGAVASATNSTQLGGLAASQYLQTSGNGSALTNLNASNITTGTLANARLGQLPTANIADGAITAAKIPTGQVVKSVNGLQDSVTLAAGSNITITPSGNTLTIASSGSAGNAILNQTTQQASSNFNISGTGTANIFSAATQYNFGGSRVLGILGFENLFVGLGAGAANTGGFNSFVGEKAGLSNTTASFNSFFGASAGEANTSGQANAFFGRSSGTSNTTGGNNAFFGEGAGIANTSGANNAFFGRSAGASNQTGSSNTALGDRAAVGNSDLTNATAVGAKAMVGTSNALVLGSISGINGAGSDTNVGIGTATPSQRLHVVGNGLFDGNLSVTGSISGTITIPAGSANYIQNTASLQASSNFNVSGNGLIGGNVGIGETTPETKLHVTSGSNTQMMIEVTGGRKWVLGNMSGNNGNFEIRDHTVGTASRFTINADGNIGAGTQGPTDRLDVNGTLRVRTLGAAGATSLCRNADQQIATCSSSLRYKDNLVPFGLGLDIIKRLKPISFTWKNGGMLDLGLGAEDVAAIEPLLATYNEKGEVEGVKYDRIGVVLVNAVKEQQEMIDRMTKQIDAQRGEIEELKKLKAAVCSIKPDADGCKP